MSRSRALLGDIPRARAKNSRDLIEKRGNKNADIEVWKLTRAGTQRDGFAAEAFNLAEMIIDAVEYANRV